MGQPEQTSTSGSNAGLVILIALVVLAVPCLGGLFLAGMGFYWVSASQPPAGAGQVAPLQVATEPIVEPAPIQFREMSTEPAADLPSPMEMDSVAEAPADESRGSESTPPAGSPAASPE